MTACTKHAKDPVVGYSQCPGCEVEGLRDAYTGAREELLEWKRRALEAEQKLREYSDRIVKLGVLSMNTAVGR